MAGIALTVSTRFGMRSYRRLSCTSIWLQALSTWFRRRTSPLYMSTDTTSTTTTTTATTTRVAVTSSPFTGQKDHDYNPPEPTPPPRTP
jgi:hypothetical protein